MDGNGEAGSNGRDPKTGRFLPGNPGGPGNPHMSRTVLLQRELEDATDPKVIRAIWHRALKMAMEGDAKMIRYVIDRMCGKPKQAIELEGDVRHTVEVMRAGFHRLHERLLKAGVEIDVN